MRECSKQLMTVAELQQVHQTSVSSAVRVLEAECCGDSVSTADARRKFHAQIEKWEQKGAAKGTEEEGMRCTQELTLTGGTSPCSCWCQPPLLLVVVAVSALAGVCIAISQAPPQARCLSASSSQSSSRCLCCYCITH